MTGPNEAKPVRGRFYRWLMRQLERDDPIGDLARDIKRDSAFPASGSLLEIRLHLGSLGACGEAVRALDEAWSEFGSDAKRRTGK